MTTLPAMSERELDALWCECWGVFLTDETKAFGFAKRAMAARDAQWQAAVDAARDEGYKIGRQAEAEYWRSMVDRLTAQADAWNARYMALVKQVADGRAAQPLPAITLQGMTQQDVQAAVDAAVMQERAECAKLVETQSANGDYGVENWFHYLADRIRARTKEKT